MSNLVSPQISSGKKMMENVGVQKEENFIVVLPEKTYDQHVAQKAVFRKLHMSVKVALSQSVAVDYAG